MRAKARPVRLIEFEAVADIRPRRAKARPVKIEVDENQSDFESDRSAAEDDAFLGWLALRLADLELAEGALLGLPLARRSEPQLWIDGPYRLEWQTNQDQTQMHLAAWMEA